ncbi:MAG: CAP domain-containing protein, partial [Clostridiales bacterium]|nr:CAP domain-containing protein [Clostridiales bacterium]
MKKLLSVLLALMLLVLPAFAAAAPSADGSSGGFSPLWTSQEWAVLRLTNIERLNRNLAPLTMTAEALEAARTRCRELKSSVSHTRPDGRECFSVLSDLGIGVSFAGENIAAGQSDAYDVVHAWMNSATHRANILDGSFSHLGASYLAGALDDPYGSYWAQVFFDD